MSASTMGVSATANHLCTIQPSKSRRTHHSRQKLQSFPRRRARLPSLSLTTFPTPPRRARPSSLSSSHVRHHRPHAPSPRPPPSAPKHPRSSPRLRPPPPRRYPIDVVDRPSVTTSGGRRRGTRTTSNVPRTRSFSSAASAARTASRRSTRGTTSPPRPSRNSARRTCPR